MQRVLVILVLAAIAVGVAYVAIDAFQGPTPAPTVTEVGPTPAPPEEGPGEVGLQAPDRLPDTEPPPHIFSLTKDARALLIVDRVRPFTAFQAQQWRFHHRLKVDTFSFDHAKTPGGTEPPLSDLPSAAFLDENDVAILALDRIDPAVFPDEFWEAVARRLKSGVMGLLVMPGGPPAGGPGGKMPSVHPMLSHPPFRALLPVAEAAPIEGRVLPGVFSGEAPFAVTTAGTSHPASRIVRWSEWSTKVWESNSVGKFAWGTKFCYPVTKTADGSLVLLQVRPAHRDTLPALIQGNPALGRVLWVGFFDFGQEPYKDPSSVDKWGALVNNWIVWLSGQVPPR